MFLKRALLFLGLFICFISKSQAPIADFSASPLVACVGENILFTNSSQTNGGSPIQGFVWDFGDGNSSTDESVSHSYALPGTYTVILVATNASGAADPEIKDSYITILPTPSAEFDPIGLGCTIPLTLSFQFNGNEQSNYSYNWDFGNGNTQNIANPDDQTYASVGEYDISLIVSNNDNGCADTVIENISISNYQADFIFPQTVCVGQSVDFQDNSTAGVNQWEWNFGGLGSSNEENPNFTFAGAGTYNIQLITNNTSSGCSGSISSDIIVEATPIPSFIADITSDCAPATINFINTSPPGETFNWVFGNGETYSGQNPPPQLYGAVGSYNVSLSMTTENGCTGSFTDLGYINVEDLSVGFESDLTGGCDPLTVIFTDSSSFPNPGNPINSWEWDFGNGNTFSGQNPPEQLYNIGLYDVSLTASTASGCIGTVDLSEYISVGELLSIDLSVDTTENCVKQDFQFSSFIETNPSNPDSSEISYFWDFTDGSATEANPTHQFTSDTGFFDVMLVVNYRGCLDSIQIDSLVYINAPISKFEPDNDLFCNPNALPVTVDVMDNSTHGLNSDDVFMVWKWGDGSPNTVMDDPELDDLNDGNNSHDFNAYGTFTIEQVIYNYTTGCSDSTTQNINISSLEPNFSLSNDSICAGDSLQLTDSSITWDAPPTPHPLVSWSFDMDNGDIVTDGPIINYAYNTPGSYNITLTATNSVECAASTSLSIEVLANPFAVIAPDNTLGCSPFVVNFDNNSISLNGLPLSSFDFSFTDDSSATTVFNTDAVEHTFNGVGTYYGTLVATDEFGCQSSPAQVPITITQPNAFFSVDNVICNQDNIIANNASNGLIPISYEWLIDGDLFSTDINLNTVFDEENIPENTSSILHDLSLVATDGNGCTDTMSNLITVSIPTAIPSFTFTGAAVNADGAYVCPPIFGDFMDSSISYGPIQSWAWSFGNGNQSVLEDPSNTYALPGVYSLGLVITDEYGCSDDTVLTDYLTIGGPSATANWFQIDGECAQGANFELNNTENVANITWYLGDGNSLEDTLSFFYYYPESNTYNPSVVISDDLGCDVIIPLDEINVGDDGLNAFFSASPNPADQNDVIFLDEGSTAESTTIVSWEWDFGNGTNAFSGVSSDQNTSYSVAGQYPIVLTITDDIGCIDSYEVLLNISDPVIWIPNVFTPNGDGVNDVLNLPYEGFQTFNILILNRWGNVMWNRTDQNGVFLWDGTDNGQEKCTDGVYFYKLSGTMFGGTQQELHGFVTVIDSE